MKKLVLLVVSFVFSLMLSAVALASDVIVTDNSQIQALLHRQPMLMCIESYDVKVGEEEKGGELAYQDWAVVDPTIGSTQILAPKGAKQNNGKAVSFASPLSNKIRITVCVLDKKEALKLHQEMTAINAQTKSRQIGQYFSWNTEKVEIDDAEFKQELADQGMAEPVRMAIVAKKYKDPQSSIVKALKWGAAFIGIGKAVKDFNKDYSDLSGLTSSAILLDSLTRSNRQQFDGAMNTMEVAAITGGF